MRSIFRSFCAALATFASLTVLAPSASAESPEMCREDAFCLWPVWVFPGEAQPPVSLVTDVNWSGEATAFRTYNGTHQYAAVEFQETLDDGSVRKYEGCFGGIWGYFTRPFTVTKVTLQDEPPSTYCS